MFKFGLVSVSSVFFPFPFPLFLGPEVLGNSWEWIGGFLSFPLNHILPHCGFEALLGFVDKECP